MREILKQNIYLILLCFAVHNCLLNTMLITVKKKKKKDKKRNCSEKINKNHASYFFVLNRHVKSTANFMEREKW
jgi:hypothetical protein